MFTNLNVKRLSKYFSEIAVDGATGWHDQMFSKINLEVFLHAQQTGL